MGNGDWGIGQDSRAFAWASSIRGGRPGRRVEPGAQGVLRHHQAELVGMAQDEEAGHGVV
jgi:hypothetical protein